MEKKRKAVLFDLDGTLLNTLEDLHNSVNFTLSCLGFAEQSLDRTRRGVGHGIPALLQRALPETGQDRLWEALRLFLLHYEVHMGDTTAPYPGTVPLLKKLREQGLQTAVVTNKDEEPARALCERCFPGLLDFVAGAVPERPRKPAPESVRYALEKLDAAVEEAVYIGDSGTDIQTAQNAGIRFLGVDWGFRDRGTLLAAGADFVAANTEELFRGIML